VTAATFAIDFGTLNGDDSFRPVAETHPRLGVVRLPAPGSGGTDSVEPPSGQAYIRRYRDAIVAANRPVRAILGYCAGGVLACAVAAALRRAGVPVPLVVIVDTHPDGGDPVAEFGRAMREMGWSPASATGLDLAAEMAELRAWCAGGKRWPAVARMERLCGQFLHDTLAARGIPPAGRERIVPAIQGRCTVWLRYVTASAALARRAYAGPMAVVSSATTAGWMVPAWTSETVRVHVLPCERHDLLRSAELPELLFRLLDDDSD
jgi:thioesterase domain-containing protein